MKNIIKLTIVIVLLFSLLAIAQNQALVVENIRFVQRTDDSFIVDIYYDVNDANNVTMFVTMLVSNTAGSTFNFVASSLTGDIGESISSGANKHIIWDFGKDHPNYSSDKIQIKIVADDGVTTPCPGIPTVTYSGKTYNTVQIGNQCWFKENLDVGTMIQSDTSGFQQTDNGVIEKYCYDNNEANCDTYGGLYEWTEVMQYVTTEGTQGICPDGWHIPTKGEWQTLQTYIGNQAATLAYERANTSGFSALFAGSRQAYDGNFSYLGYVAGFAFFWSSTTENGSYAYDMNLYYNYSIIFIIPSKKDYGYSVRCLKD